jgi:hypothetical protein
VAVVRSAYESDFVSSGWMLQPKSDWYLPTHAIFNNDRANKKNAQPLRVFLKQRDLPRLRKEIDEAPKSVITLNDIVVVSNR